MGENDKEFDVTELDDGDLEGAAGGMMIAPADPNNCDCTINNCKA